MTLVYGLPGHLHLELLDFHLTTGGDHGNVQLERGRGRVSIKEFLAGPCLTDHEDVFACTTLKDVVGDATFLFLGLCHKGDGGIQGIGVLAGLCLEKTIETNHNSMCLGFCSCKYRKKIRFYKPRFCKNEIFYLILCQ